jgi:hypothetical protein
LPEKDVEDLERKEKLKGFEKPSDALRISIEAGDETRTRNPQLDLQ